MREFINQNNFRIIHFNYTYLFRLILGTRSKQTKEKSVVIIIVIFYYIMDFWFPFLEVCQRVVRILITYEIIHFQYQTFNYSTFVTTFMLIRFYNCLFVAFILILRYFNVMILFLFYAHNCILSTFLMPVTPTSRHKK